MEGLLPIFGSWSQHSKWCHDRKGVGCATGAHSSEPTTWALCAQHESLTLGRDINFAVATWLGWGRQVLGCDMIFMSQQGGGVVRVGQAHGCALVRTIEQPHAQQCVRHGFGVTTPF